EKVGSDGGDGDRDDGAPKSVTNVADALADVRGNFKPVRHAVQKKTKKSQAAPGLSNEKVTGLDNEEMALQSTFVRGLGKQDL
ncbi:unnamed protein product, partial [Amoebophrya sp. A25]